MFSFFFFNDTATTEIYTLSLHDALPICAFSASARASSRAAASTSAAGTTRSTSPMRHASRSEEHTSELQSRPHLVCRLLLEKKKTYPLRHHRHLVHQCTCRPVHSVCAQH